MAAAGKAAIAAGCAALLTAMVPVLLVAAIGGANAAPNDLCGAGGSATTVTSVKLSAEQMADADTIVDTTAAFRPPLPSYAAVVALATSYQEARLLNSAIQTDHDSEGLFQQRVSIYTAAVATDPVKATQAFLTRLTRVPNWQTIPLTQAAQAVQISANPDAYAQWQPLAAALTAQMWGPAVATHPTGLTTSPGTIDTPICPGGDGANPSEGHHGNNVAGSPTVPGGLTLSGTPAGDKAVTYALAQLGKPYVFGAAGPGSFDCSGLTMAAWATAGIPLPHLAATQAQAGSPESPDLSQAVSGDLVFIPGSDGTTAEPGHVGMVAGYTETSSGRHLYLIQAPGWQNLPIEVTDSSEWVGDIVSARHIA